MNGYLENVDESIKDYFNILEPNFPSWLNDYINTKELLSQQYISITCGTIYSDLFESSFFYSSLDHSIAVALIVWHFTHDKKQALAGLFHDIATPVFKHCVDYLNGDFMTQESTEDLTTEIIKNSKEIMSLLKRDGIKIEEVDNYHIYPIADNDTPKLSADRLEYSLSNALFTYKLLGFNDIRDFYNDVNIQINENSEAELGFKTKKVAIDFVKITSKLSAIYQGDKTRYSMQLLADILKRLNNEGKITKKELYELKELDVVKIIENSKYSKIFNYWRNAKSINVSKTEPKGVYYVRHASKIRYINPLFDGKRISECSSVANKLIEDTLSYKMTNYIYLNFNFDE